MLILIPKYWYCIIIYKYNFRFNFVQGQSSVLSLLISKLLFQNCCFQSWWHCYFVCLGFIFKFSKSWYPLTKRWLHIDWKLTSWWQKAIFSCFLCVTEMTISLTRLVPAFTIVSSSNKVLFRYWWTIVEILNWKK